VAGEPDALIGSVIDGRYEVRAQLGHGGMGRLYRAWQKSVSREVAIKLIDRSLLKDPMAATRFQREAELASKLSHPNTVSVFDFGRTADGQMYIAMELIAGKTLTSALREQGAFAVPRIVRIGIQLCDALEAAHRLGIVHRDLKLDNVMVIERDLVKILDFGLAKRFDDVSGTGVGIVVGTPRYIAPEVSTSGIATPASDMYAIGMMLTELAIGGPLWGGDSLGQLLAKKLDPAPAIAQVPAGLRAVTRALLDVSPERRPTAVQARELLVRLGNGEVIEEVSPPTMSLRPSAPTVRDRPVAQSRTRRRWVIAGAAGGAVIASVVAVLATRDHDRKHPETLTGAPGSATASGSAVAPSSAVAVTPADAAGPDPWGSGDSAGRLVPLAGTVQLRVTSFPRGGKLLVDTNSIGTTPATITMPSGTRKIRIGVQRDGAYGEVWVVPDHDKHVHVIMTRPASLHGDCAWCLPEGGKLPPSTLLKIRGPAGTSELHIAGQTVLAPPVDLLVRRTSKELELKVGSKTVYAVPDHDQTVLVDSCDDCAE